MIKAVIFDYGGVLMRTVDPRPRRELEHELGLERFGTDRLVFGHPLWDHAQLGEVASERFWGAVAERLGVDAEGLDAFRQRFWAGDRLDRNLVALIEGLRGRGYAVGLLSNNPASLRQRVEALMPGIFDSCVISGQDGVMKPDPAIYALALERLGMQPGEAVFVDDAERNVEGARRAGLEAIHFRGLALLRRDLRALGVSVPDAEVAQVAGIRALVVAWEGVLATPLEADYLDQKERELGLVPGKLGEVLQGADYRRLQAGWITWAEFARLVGHRLGLSDTEEATQLLDEASARRRARPLLLDALRVLRGRYRVGLVASARPSHAAWLRERLDLDVDQEFDVYANSTEVGVPKSDPTLYEHLFGRLCVQPGQCVAIDDGLRAVDAARAVGCHTIQFVCIEGLLRDLEALLGHTIVER